MERIAFPLDDLLWMAPFDRGLMLTQGLSSLRVRNLTGFSGHAVKVLERSLIGLD